MACGPGTLAMAFDATNPEAVAWVEREAANLIVDISTEARAAIRAVVSGSFEAGISPSETARLIRSSIGLTERDAGAVVKKHLGFLAEGMDGKKAAAKAEKYADKLLASRSKTIARTETMRASNEGQEQLWAQARSKGLLDSSVKKTWIAFDPCPICAPLDGEVVGLDEDFSIGTDPPAHPNCRCTIGLV